MGEDGEVPVDLSELSSLAEMLDQLTARIAKMAQAASAEPDDAISPELFAVERALSGAQRGEKLLVVHTPLMPATSRVWSEAL